MTKIVITQAAPPGSVFGQASFDGQVGQEVPFLVEEHRAFRATMVAAAVSPSGESVRITLDVPDLVLPIQGFSFEEVDGS